MKEVFSRFFVRKALYFFLIHKCSDTYIFTDLTRLPENVRPPLLPQKMNCPISGNTKKIRTFAP
ncbi:MAG: hypothetical protein D6714_18845 [Bacteroidetes bacterium]|nr:MAG: hypothetical protein D6714_18845 [Bacteroidota bacterium]